MKNNNKTKKKITKKQMRAFIRPMFSSTIAFGYATKHEVEKTLDKMFEKIKED